MQEEIRKGKEERNIYKHSPLITVAGVVTCWWGLMDQFSLIVGSQKSSTSLNIVFMRVDPSSLVSVHILFPSLSIRYSPTPVLKLKAGRLSRKLQRRFMYLFVHKEWSECLQPKCNRVHFSSCSSFHLRSLSTPFLRLMQCKVKTGRKIANWSELPSSTLLGYLILHVKPCKRQVLSGGQTGYNVCIV